MTRRMNDHPPESILWGGTGQAKVMRPFIEAAGSRVIAVFDDTVGLTPPFPDVPLVSGRLALPAWLEGRDPTKLGFTIAIGNPHGAVRVALDDLLTSHGLRPLDVAHPSAVIADDATIGAGCQIHPGAIIMPQVRLGRQCIVNTKASVDHECRLGDGVEIGPGATLCGEIVVDDHAWVGAGATILPRVHIGEGAIVGAGALVRTAVPAHSTYVGVPARPLLKETRSA